MAAGTIILVDDDEIIRHTLSKLLWHKGVAVTAAGSVLEALTLINSGVHDVLLSDLHMPGAGNGLTVVSAMRHSNPKAVTMLLTSFPGMKAAAHAMGLLVPGQLKLWQLSLNARLRNVSMSGLTEFSMINS
jgi:CheY-like chemotaxis protein